MKRIIWLCCLLCAGALADPLPVLHLYDWQGGIPDVTIQRFERHCQCRVDKDAYGDNEEMAARLRAGAGEYDVVFPSSFALSALVRQRLLMPLDKSLLPNLVNLEPIMANPDYDPGNQYAVPATMSLTAVGYNIDKLKQLDIDPYSWSVIFDPRVLARIKGRITVLDSPRQVFAAAFLYLKIDPNHASDDDYQRAYDLIMAAKPYWAAFSNDRYLKDLVAGDVWVSLGSSTAFFQAREMAQREHRPFTIGYVPQREGNELRIDGMAVPARAPHPELAMRFINFMLAGRNAADQTNLLGATNPVRTAEPFYSDDVKYHPVINPDITALRQWIVLRELNPKTQRLLTRLWGEIRMVPFQHHRHEK